VSAGEGCDSIDWTDAILRAYAGRLAISQAKKKDLLSLLKSRIIPADYESFYNNLPTAVNASCSEVEPADSPGPTVSTRKRPSCSDVGVKQNSQSSKVGDKENSLQSSSTLVTRSVRVRTTSNKRLVCSANRQPHCIISADADG